MTVSVRHAAVALAIALILAGCSSDDDNTSTASDSTAATTTSPVSAPDEPARVPTVSGPVTGGNGVQAVGISYDFASVGYVFEEFFIEGNAVGYEATGDLPPDGKWDVEETDTAPFKTRIVVVRPADPANFSGTVFVEWFNVTGGVDAGPTFLMAHNQMLRSGAVWVGVTAQAVGVNGAEETVQSEGVDIPEGGLVSSDPARYGSLVHPGDLFSYDIFTQAGTAIRGEGEGVKPLPGFDVERVVAMGESQSAFRLTTYVNAVQPLAGEYDGFLIHSRGGEAAPLDDSPIDLGDETTGDVLIRTDIDVPVFTFETEYDVDVLGFADARQPDTDHFRLWEVAGTSHIDSYTGGAYSLADLGDGAAEAAILDPSRASGGVLGCAEPTNAGAQHAALVAALSHLEAWIRDGTAPPEFPRIETTGEGDGIEIVRDDLGIAVGGVRTPIIDVPLAVNIGDDTNSPDFCRVFGHTTPLDAPTLAQRYPNGSADYVPAFTAAVDEAVAAGVWLEPEAENFKAAAPQIAFPS